MAINSLAPPPLRDPFTPTGGQPSGPSGVSYPWIKFFQQLQSLAASQPAGLIGTHAQRLATPASTYTDGSTFYETDTGLYYVVSSGVWTYSSGVESATQATLPMGLGVGDAGLLVNVTDFGHQLRWTGTVWDWSANDPGSGFIQAFAAAPTKTGWHLCDGSTVSRLNGDGTLSSVTLPDYTTAAYLKLALSASSGPNAPSGNTALVSAGTPVGTISTPTFTGTPGTTSVESADLNNVATTGSATAAAQNHTHTLTPAGTISTPTFTGSALAGHHHGPGDLELENTVLLAYFRQ